MSTRERSVHRGFDFSTEENEVAIRQMQTNLSERPQSNRNLADIHDVPEKTGTPKRRRDIINFHATSCDENYYLPSASFHDPSLMYH